MEREETRSRAGRSRVSGRRRAKTDPTEMKALTAGCSVSLASGSPRRHVRVPLNAAWVGKRPKRAAKKGEANLTRELVRRFEDSRIRSRQQYQATAHRAGAAHLLLCPVAAGASAQDLARIQRHKKWWRTRTSTSIRRRPRRGRGLRFSLDYSVELFFLTE